MADPTAGTAAVEASPRDRLVGRRAVLAFTGTGAAVAVAGWQWQRPHYAREPLYGVATGIRWDGARVLVEPGGEDRLVPGSRVVRDASAADQVDEAVRTERAWLGSGRVPGMGTRWEPMARIALLDLRALLVEEGALVAGWSGSWRHVWPRDAGFGVAALASTGHLPDAMAVLSFLARAQEPSGRFEARYLLDGSGPPDARGIQLDGSGWAVWAVHQVSLSEAAEPAALAALRPMVDRSVGAIVDLLDPTDGLPPVSADYWETPERHRTLGTAAALLAGLQSAVALYGRWGDGMAAAGAQRAAERLRAGVERAFGPRYPRYPGQRDRDAAVTFLLPPIAATPRPEVARLLPRVAGELARPAGGLAPGAGWQADGISWTPETALFALAHAAAGDRRRAERLLDWLDRHRSTAGSLPEKVLHDGSPAGPAPLSWTSALVLLALDRLDRR